MQELHFKLKSVCIVVSNKLKTQTLGKLYSDEFIIHQNYIFDIEGSFFLFVPTRYISPSIKGSQPAI